MNFKDKNNVVLAISAALIVIAILIAVTATVVEHKKSNNDTTTSSKEVVDNVDSKPQTDNKTPDSTPPTTDTKPQKPVANSGDSKIGKYKVATKNDPLGVRISPKSEAERVTEIAKGSEVEVLAINGDWGYVEVNSVSGWVSLKYLELISASTKLPTYAPGKYKIGTKDDPLGIRTKPMDDATRNGEIPKGETVEILAVKDSWGFVQYKDKEGWLSFKYLVKE